MEARRQQLREELDTAGAVRKPHPEELTAREREPEKPFSMPNVAPFLLIQAA